MSGLGEWNRPGWKVSVAIFLLQLLLMGFAHGDKAKSHSHFNRNMTGLIAPNHNFRLRREIPEAMLDPYSVLGVLSFGVYIFYILYTRYRMRGHHNPSPQNQNANIPQQPPQGAPQLFSVDTQENIANIIKMATNIISNAPYLGMSNSTLDGDDYFDAADASDLRSQSKVSGKK